MRRTDIDGNFLLVWAMNMILNYQCGIVALICWAVAYWFDMSYLPAIFFLAAWILVPLWFTVVMKWLGENAGRPDMHRENKNPYSSRTEDIFKEEK